MTMFITGGTSSIGRVLVKELSRQGQPSRVLVRQSSNRTGLELPGVEFVFGDVTDPDKVCEGMLGCQQVTHMAAIVGSDLPEAEWWRVNRDGSRNILQAAYDLGVESIVQVSTLSVLGPTRPGEIADETRPIDPGRHVNLYQKTKFAADEIARELSVKGLPVKIIYPAFGYGCSHASSHPSLQEMTLLRMAAGKPLVIMGSGKNQLCLAYYKDTVAGILLAHTHGKTGESYLLGNDNLTFVELWARIAAVLDKPPPRRKVSISILKFFASVSKLALGKSFLPPDFLEMVGRNWCFSAKKAIEQLGWQPHAFRDGIAETWAEYQAQGWTSQENRSRI